ncbi:MAG TPA: hypothetical protein VIF62_14635 [Labilithrix sp.]|jgi:hypothetical protein
MLEGFDASFAKRSLVVATLLALAVSIVACGGPSKPAAAPEADAWADYKGTFAEPGGAQPKAATTAKSAVPKEDVAKSSAPLTATETTDAPPPPAKTKAKHKANGGRKAKAKTKKSDST